MRSVIFPEANVEVLEISAPDWMRSEPSAVRNVEFGRSERNEEPPRQEPEVVHTPPPPPPDPLAEARAELARMEAALNQRSAELDAREAELDAREAELAQHLEVIADAAGAITEAADEAQARAREDIAEIAVAVARALVFDAIDEAPERAEALVRGAMQASGDGATARVGTALHVALLERGSTLPATLDPSLSPYACVVESPRGPRILAGIEERLAEVLEALREAT